MAVITPTSWIPLRTQTKSLHELVRSEDSKTCTSPLGITHNEKCHRNHFTMNSFIKAHPSHFPTAGSVHTGELPWILSLPPSRLPEADIRNHGPLLVSVAHNRYRDLLNMQWIYFVVCYRIQTCSRKPRQSANFGTNNFVNGLECLV